MGNAEFTSSQIDRLGVRIRDGAFSETELRALDQFRLSFSEAYEFVAGTLRIQFGLEVTGRPAKSTSSIVEKLRRESIRLTQVQDIAGCRVVVADIPAQNQLLNDLRSSFESLVVVDRRRSPSHGYRAVHAIAKFRGKQVEIQIRTVLQHRWAELSEKLADVADPRLKYGNGREDLQTPLLALSNGLSEFEDGVPGFLGASRRFGPTPTPEQQSILTMEKLEFDRARAQVAASIDALLNDLHALRLPIRE
jgi:ppGpp synthetase/RelA/SpoT-type nucleotidyltranferase